VCAVLAPAPARGSPTGALIGSQIDISLYQHYLEDLLYTHLGDNRGFGAQHDPARANIVATLQSFGLSVVEEPFVYNTVTYYNVVATRLGTDAPSEIYIVGAHYDSVDNPGADDNGTGTALVMEVARVLSQHRTPRTIRFVLFDREEQGRRGSIAFNNTHLGENMIMAVTADMVGHDSGAYGMDIYGRTTSSTVVNGVGSAITTYGNGLNPFINLGNYSFSDHWSFEARGIPSCVIIERCFTCNTYYHTQSDAVDIYPGYISYPMVADLLRSVTGYLVDQVGISLWGDADVDADIDTADLNAFRACFGAPITNPCRAFDRDLDGDVDCADWPAFRTAYLASSGTEPLLDPADFAGVLLGTNLSAADACITDLNGDGRTDAADIGLYVDRAAP
jgi:hypothetical protein